MEFWHLALLSLACLLAALPTAVRAHGFMFEPAARNVVHNSDYCPHCLASGGPYEVSAYNTLTWPDGIRYVCGSKEHDIGGIYGPTAPVRTYSAGSTFSISLLLESNHGGRHMFRLCDSSNADEACLAQHVLQRADGTGPYTWVHTEPVGGPAFPASGYAPTGTLLDQTGEVYTLDYKLPDGVTCTACTLQWWWTTSNSCDIPGNPLGGSDLGACNTPQPGPYPEEFFNCADISITGGGSRQPSNPTQAASTTALATMPAPTADATSSTSAASTPTPTPSATPSPTSSATTTPIPSATTTPTPSVTPSPTSSANTTPIPSATTTAAPGTTTTTTTAAPSSEASTSYSRKMVPGGDAGCNADCACQTVIDGVTAAPWSCAEFVLCAGAKGESQACDPGLLWDIAANACNFAVSVDCGGRPRP